jgi:hypothetical protein
VKVEGEGQGEGEKRGRERRKEGREKNKKWLKDATVNIHIFSYEASIGGIKWLIIVIFSYYEAYERSVADTLIGEIGLYNDYRELWLQFD